MWPASRERGTARRGGALAVALVLATGWGCRTLPLQEPARTPRPVPPGLEAVLTPRHPAWDLELDHVESHPDWDRFLLSFRTFCDVAGEFRAVRGELYRSCAAAQGPVPLLAVSPILAGPVDDYLASRFISRSACAVGLSAFFLHQETTILDPRRDALELEARLRQSVRDYRKAIDLLAACPGIDARRLGGFGVSLGAIRTVILQAVEPRLNVAVVGLAGTGLAELLLTSREALVASYLEGRRRLDGLPAGEVAAEFRTWFASEPGRCAEALAPSRVLLFLGRFDDKVPYASGLKLRRALGRPRTIVLPLGHYTAVLAVPWLASASLRWIREGMGGMGGRCSEPGSTPSAHDGVCSSHPPAEP